MVAAILLCAGKSLRMGEDKMLLDVGGMPVWQRSLHALLAVEEIGKIIIVASEAVAQVAEPVLGQKRRCEVRLVMGGETRQDSVYSGLLAAEGAEIVLIQDAARCLSSAALMMECIASARQYGSGVAGVPATDTLKRMEDGWAVETLRREQVYQAQTPQTFAYALIRGAYEKAREAGVTATDDAMLLERLGHKVRMVEAQTPNFKLTTAQDALLVRALLGTGLRVGFGEDAHRLAEGRRLVLGGVTVAYERGLMGHSDADVLIHAVMDALLGAAAMGDIGGHFPPNELYKDADSLLLLGEVGTKLRAQGMTPVNIDATVVAEAPRLSPYIADMRQNIAGALGLCVSAVSVKATTTEGMGFEGRGEGMSARAVATICATSI